MNDYYKKQDCCNNYCDSCCCPIICNSGITGPTGATGATGPTGIAYNRSDYLVTFNNGSSADGIVVPADDRLPIDRKDLDISSLITLDENENTIQFDVEGYYKITAQGIIAVENIANAYELVNVGKNDIYLNTPTLDNIQSGSYFTNSLVTIIIEYLARQGA